MKGEGRGCEILESPAYFFTQALDQNVNWLICSRPKMSVFLLYSRDIFNAILESLMFTRVSVFVFEVSVWKCVPPCRPASAHSFSTRRPNLVLTHGIPPALRGGVILCIPPTAIESVPSYITLHDDYVPMLSKFESPQAQGQ